MDKDFQGLVPIFAPALHEAFFLAQQPVQKVSHDLFEHGNSPCDKMP